MNELLNLLTMALLSWAGRTIYVLSVEVKLLSKVITQIERRMERLEKNTS